MKQRWISLLLAMAMLLSVLPVSTVAAEAVPTQEAVAEPAANAPPDADTLDASAESTEPDGTEGPDTPDASDGPQTQPERPEDSEHTHQYTAVVTAPTCTADGCTTYTCDCGDTYTEAGDPATGHSPVTDPAATATCTADGQTEGSHCGTCGETLTAQQPVAKLGHDYENGVCIRCGDVTTKLEAPVVTVTNVEKSGKNRLNWDAVDGAVRYWIYCATEKNGTYTRIYTVTSTQYTHKAGEAGTRYYYYVLAVASDGTKSAPSATVSRLCDLARPVVTASNVPKTGKVQLSWEPVAGAVSYQVYCAAEGGTYQRLKTVTGTSHIHQKGTAGVRYTYKVKAVAENTYANSAYSAGKARTCDLPRPVVTASNVPETGKVQLSWEPVAGAVSYKVYCAETRDGTYQLLKTVTGTSHVHQKGIADVSYFYRVRAVAANSKANSADSAIKNRACDLPQPVIQRYAPNAAGKPRLTWQAVPGAVEYEIYRAKTPDGTYQRMYTTTGTAYNNTSATAGQTYYYQVRAMAAHSRADSACSASVQVTAVENVYRYVYSSYTTYKYGSAARNTNLSLACRAINGTILAPGETFSFNAIVGPRTAAKGYQIAPQTNGQGRGGGICQIATTLYNLVLLGNLKITDRSQHSAPVSYVPIGRDAMIYTTKCDFQFVNTSPYYIKVQAIANGGNVSLKLLTREDGVSPVDDVELNVTQGYENGRLVYTLTRTYQGARNYRAKTRY